MKILLSYLEWKLMNRLMNGAPMTPMQRPHALSREDIDKLSGLPRKAGENK